LNLDIACPKCGKRLQVALAQINPALDQLKGARVRVNIEVRTRRPWWKFWGA